MTNLFLNDSRMNNRAQIIPGFGEANKAETLAKVKSVFFQYFEQVVDDCCMRIDLEFGVQLGKNREKINKDQYIKLLEYLRSVRKEIKHNYLFKVNAIYDGSYQKIANNPRGQFDFSKVALISDDAVKENHVIAAIIGQCEHLFYEELTSLNHMQFANLRGEQTIAASQNPIFPEKLVRALVEVVKSLKLNTDGRIALYKAFEANVFNQLGFIYCELIKRYETSSSTQLYVVSEIKEAVEPTPVSAEQPSMEFKRLQKKLELWRLAQFPSAYDSIPATENIFYECFEVKNALQVLQQFNNDSDLDEKKQPLKWRALKKLEELRFTDKAKSLNKDDEDLLDLVSLIFSEIAQDELLQDSVKTAILQLEIPLSAAALGRYSIFTSPDNPVRQLLDDLFAAGMFLNLDEYDDRLIQERIASAVNKITRDSSLEFSGWTAEAGEFSCYLSKQKQRSQNIDENTIQFMRTKQESESNRKVAVIAIENSMKGKMLPIAIVEFLRNVWSEVLLTAYTGKNEQPEQWEKSVQAMNELIVSVMPPADDQQRKQILKCLPGMIAELRKGLKQISYDKSAQSRFFKDLAVWHIILMDKKDRIGKDIVVPIQDKKIKGVEIADEYSEQAMRVAEQSWVAFDFESGRQWGKLLWKDVENMLFVGKNGGKILEIRIDELAEKLRTGQAVIATINDKMITEQVFTKLMSL
jgi:hypothetical protein